MSKLKNVIIIKHYVGKNGEGDGNDNHFSNRS
jgi:hypothetical protein